MALCCVVLRSVRSLPIGNNTLTIRTFLFSPRSLVPQPACTASFCVFFFYRPTGRLSHTSLPLECHRKPNNSEALRFKRAAFYNGLKSKVGLAAAKAAALRVNVNVQGCGIVAPQMHAPSRTGSGWLSHRLRRGVREGACIGGATMPQPWTLRLTRNTAALAAASPTLLFRPL